MKESQRFLTLIESGQVLRPSSPEMQNTASLESQVLPRMFLFNTKGRLMQHIEKILGRPVTPMLNSPFDKDFQKINKFKWDFDAKLTYLLRIDYDQWSTNDHLRCHYGLDKKDIVVVRLESQMAGLSDLSTQPPTPVHQVETEMTALITRGANPRALEKVKGSEYLNLLINDLNATSEKLIAVSAQQRKVIDKLKKERSNGLSLVNDMRAKNEKLTSESARLKNQSRKYAFQIDTLQATNDELKSKSIQLQTDSDALERENRDLRENCRSLKKTTDDDKALLTQTLLDVEKKCESRIELAMEFQGSGCRDMKLCLWKLLGKSQRYPAPEIFRDIPAAIFSRAMFPAEQVSSDMIYHLGCLSGQIKDPDVVFGLLGDEIDRRSDLSLTKARNGQVILQDVKAVAASICTRIQNTH